MSGIGFYTQNIPLIEASIARCGIALNINWSNEAQVRQLAREALFQGKEAELAAGAAPGDRQLLAKAELFGLAGLMLKTMQESAETGFETHGGPVWKAFGRALYLESLESKA